jgi:lysophospholipase L1-like esterase
MAFGNSITEGKDGSNNSTANPRVANPYPSVLNTLLAARYPTQQITVENRGFGGEETSDGSDRIKTELDSVRPDILLLEEGVNDLSGGNPAAIAPMVDALADMVAKARVRGVGVFIATLLPARPFSFRGQGPARLIADANIQIRLLAQREHVTLVDLYAGLGGSPDPYIDVDGLHPTEAGYRKMAEIFFDAINATLAQSTAPASTGYVRNRLPEPLPFALVRP